MAPKVERHVSSFPQIAVDAIRLLEPGAAVRVITRARAFDGVAVYLGFDMVGIVDSSGKQRNIPWTSVTAIEPNRDHSPVTLPASHAPILAHNSRIFQARRQYLAFTERESAAWSALAPKIRVEIAQLRTLSWRGRHRYLRRVDEEVTARIQEHLGVKRFGAHYNLHGGRASRYVEAGGIYASYGGDIALQFDPRATPRWGTYLYESGSRTLMQILDERNPSRPFWGSRMGTTLVLFDVDGPFISRARSAQGAWPLVGAFQQFNPRWLAAEPVNAGRNAYSLIGFPLSEFLIPPVGVFQGVGTKIGMRLRRAEENLATLRHLENLLLTTEVQEGASPRVAHPSRRLSIPVTQ